ncbi:MAG TPA: ADP-ribosylglycohydrolase family protein [Sandaracinaceae bacterium LLY-WYZ-13_1]|nr:ADP-ribosylglycohydrolase family protein [Sandaracinaceae bacterium LLY-WYZ-13_1]
MTPTDRARRSLDGLSVGDAFGERFFVHPYQARSLIEARALPATPWRWTDDTAMAIAIVEELEAAGTIDEASLANRFAARYAAEPWRGYGGGAHGILSAVARGEDWARVAGAAFGGEGSMGNGGAMRVAPLGAWFADAPLSRVVEEARRSARPTHQHPDGQAGAIAVAVAAAAAGQRRAPVSPAALFEPVLAHTPEGPTRDGIARAAELSLDASMEEAVAALGNGSGVIARDTVPFCLWCVARHADDFEAAMWATVSGLGDRDTTCAIVGGVVALTSAAPVPAEWLEGREPLA